jgi:hypothetical protein
MDEVYNLLVSSCIPEVLPLESGRNQVYSSFQTWLKRNDLATSSLYAIRDYIVNNRIHEPSTDQFLQDVAFYAKVLDRKIDGASLYRVTIDQASRIREWVPIRSLGSHLPTLGMFREERFNIQVAEQLLRQIFNACWTRVNIPSKPTQKPFHVKTDAELAATLDLVLDAEWKGTQLVPLPITRRRCALMSPPRQWPAGYVISV